MDMDESLDSFETLEISDDKAIEKTDDNFRILYITGIIILSIFLIWIIIYIFTSDDEIKILNEMLDESKQLKLAT